MSFIEIPNIRRTSAHRGASYTVWAVEVASMGGSGSGNYQGVYEIGASGAGPGDREGYFDTISDAVADAERRATLEIDRRMDSKSR